MTLLVLFEVIPPAVYLRVTENVPQIVSFIGRIIENGHAYATQEGELFGTWNAKKWNNGFSWPSDGRTLASFAGDVYFDIKSIGERYGKFGGAADSQPEPGELSKNMNTKAEEVFLFVVVTLLRKWAISRKGEI